MRRGLGWLCGALALSGCASQAPPAPPAAPPGAQAAKVARVAKLADADIGTMPALGSTVSGTVRALGRDLVLPDGDWLVVAEDKALAPGLPPLARLVLLRLLGGHFAALLEIAGNALGHPARQGWPTNPVCAVGLKRGRNEQVLAANHEAFMPHGDQDCLAVVFLPGTSWWDAENGLSATAKMLAAAKVALPATTIGLSLGEDDAQYRLIERVWLNPELSGIAPDRSSDPARSDWRASHVRHDRARRDYLARVMRFAAAWRQQIRRALTAADPPGMSLPPLP